LDVVAGAEGRHAAEAGALLAALGAGAPDDVVDLGGVDAVALGDGLEHGGAQLLGMEGGEGALAPLADATGGAAGVDDPDSVHGDYLCGRVMGSGAGTSRGVN